MEKQKPSHNIMIPFELFVSAQLTGLRALGPAGGFSGASTPHFFELECLSCGDRTTKDVALYVLAPGEEGCTKSFGARMVCKHCYPTCSNYAHLVRKCKGCNLLGSVELISKADMIEGGERALALSIMSMGYKPIHYFPGPGWVGTTTAGDVVKIEYNSAGVFTARDPDATTHGPPATAKVQFELKAEKEVFGKLKVEHVVKDDNMEEAVPAAVSN